MIVRQRSPGLTPSFLHLVWFFCISIRMDEDGNAINKGGGGSKASNHARFRFAKGEVNEEEYLRMRKLP